MAFIKRYLGYVLSVLSTGAFGTILMSHSRLLVFKNITERRFKSVKDIEELKVITGDLLEQHGFTHFAFAKIIGENDFSLSVSNIPKGMTEEYIENEITNYDGMLQYIERNVANISVKKIIDFELSAPFLSRRLEKHKKLREIMTRYGMFDNLALPKHVLVDGKKEITAFCVYSQHLDHVNFKEHIAVNMPYLHIISDCFYHYGFRRFSEKVFNQKNQPFLELTKREKEILLLHIKNDFNTDKVAIEICREVATIRKHTANIRRKLGVNSTAEAVMACIREGVLKL